MNFWSATTPAKCGSNIWSPGMGHHPCNWHSTHISGAMQHTVLPSENNPPSGWLAALLLAISTQPVERVLSWESHDLPFFLDPERECRLVGSSEESVRKWNVVRYQLQHISWYVCVYLWFFNDSASSTDYPTSTLKIWMAHASKIYQTTIVWHPTRQ